MTFPIPSTWTKDTADARRDEAKRKCSPTSYFYSQGQSLVLAAKYFIDDRLTEEARGGIASKHRHRIHLALYGQLMAAFEYCLKDFFAKAVDVISIYDERIKSAKWIQVDATKVLSARYGNSSPGSILLHSTQGWHYPKDVNARFKEFFDCEPITDENVVSLERLWIIRHSVAHNNGFMIHTDAARLGTSLLSEKVMNIDDGFLSETFNLLDEVVAEVANVAGNSILKRWLATVKSKGEDFQRDELIYASIKQLGCYTRSRVKDIPAFIEAEYKADWPK